MNARQNKYEQMQSKLNEGLEKLEELSEDDSDRMGIVLIKLHGALEDFVRLEVAEKAPHLREAVEDAKQTNWKNLLDYGKTYLGFTENDCRIITEANNQRQKVAHGGNYEKKLADLKNYALFVQKWCKHGSISAADNWSIEQVIEPQRPPQPTYHPTYQPIYQPPPVRESEWVYKYSRPDTVVSVHALSHLFLFVPHPHLGDSDAHRSQAGLLRQVFRPGSAQSATFSVQFQLHPIFQHLFRRNAEPSPTVQCSAHSDQCLSVNCPADRYQHLTCNISRHSSNEHKHHLHPHLVRVSNGQSGREKSIHGLGGNRYETGKWVRADTCPILRFGC